MVDIFLSLTNMLRKPGHMGRACKAGPRVRIFGPAWHTNRSVGPVFGPPWMKADPRSQGPYGRPDTTLLLLFGLFVLF